MQEKQTTEKKTKKSKTKKSKVKNLKCKVCKKSFKPKEKTQKFCSVSCATTTKQVGRPKADLELYYTKIKPYLQQGYSINKSCILAGIPPTTISDYTISDPNFSERIKADQEYASVLSRNIILGKLKDKDEATAKWWLERKNKDEFSLRNETNLTIDFEKKWNELLEGLENEK
jgi:hypothetical protein